MFDDVPARFWLMLVILLSAYPQAAYLVRHIAHSPSRRDITKPQPDLSWRTPEQFIRSLVILVLLAALAIFIFTPTAEDFARSPRLFPLFLAIFGVGVLYTVGRALVTGRSDPLLRGFDLTFCRSEMPKRYWASIGWNVLVGSFLLWAAHLANGDASAKANWDRCFAGWPGVPGATRSACSKVLGGLNEQIRTDPDEPAFRYNRGLVHHHLGGAAPAIDDFDAAIRLQPGDPDFYLGRGRVHLDSNRLDQAIADFTKAHELAPKDAWPLAYRGLAYALKQDQGSARRDLAAASARDRSNAIVMRGRAMLSMQDADLEGAIAHLSALLEQAPNDPWALRMRAWNYRQADQPGKAELDETKIRQIMREAGLPTNAVYQ